MSGSESPTKRAVLALRKEEGNDICADCGQKDPEWADVSFGVFICIGCSGIHRSLGAHLCKVKSVQLDEWTDESVKAMTGNKHAQSIWEASVPTCCKPPRPEEALVCREQWIRAKYERKEFVLEATDDERPYTIGMKKGFLFKKKKVDNVYNSRFFILDTKSVSYFKKISDSTPTEVIPLADLNVTMNGQTGHPNGMQMTALIRGKSRNYFVYAESGLEIINWFYSIRAARLRLLQGRHPDKPVEELYSSLSRDFVKTGYLHKTPANKLQKFQKRYFVLDMNRLSYFEKPTDAFPLGEIIIDASSEGFSVDEQAPDELGGGENAFVLNTPTRTFPLLAETAHEKLMWIEALRDAIEKSRTSPNAAASNAFGTSYGE